jgi:flagellar basal-body rod protein FlgC
MINNATSAMFRTLRIAASGLSAQRQRLETIATNIANAETTRTADGTPYRRRMVELGTQTTAAALTDPLFTAQAVNAAVAGEGLEPTTGVSVSGIVEDMTEGPLVYDPGHPDADQNGYVRMPNVRVTDEMVDLMDARRVYEANATVFQSAKAMLRRSIDI